MSEGGHGPAPTVKPADPVDDPADDLVEDARKLFAGTADFLWGASRADGLPPMQGVEIAFAGRSNVGKSSLVNALTGRRTLARTSHTPGRTQELNFFDLGGRVTIVDMPGYGFAAAGKSKVEAWTRLIKTYLRGRANLARVYVLVDARHGFKAIDLDMLALLDAAAVSYQVVATKLDEVAGSKLAERLATMTAALARRPAAFPELAPTSSRTGEGVPELRAGILRLLRERGEAA